MKSVLSIHRGEENLRTIQLQGWGCLHHLDGSAACSQPPCPQGLLGLDDRSELLQHRRWGAGGAGNTAQLSLVCILHASLGCPQAPAWLQLPRTSDTLQWCQLPALRSLQGPHCSPGIHRLPLPAAKPTCVSRKALDLLRSSSGVAGHQKERGVMFLNFYTEISMRQVKHGSSKAYSFPLHQQLKMPVHWAIRLCNTDCGAGSNYRQVQRRDMQRGDPGVCPHAVLPPESTTPNLKAVCLLSPDAHTCGHTHGHTCAHPPSPGLGSR